MQYFFNFYLITNCKVAPGLKRLPEFCQDVLQSNFSLVTISLFLYKRTVGCKKFESELYD